MATITSARANHVRWQLVLALLVFLTGVHASTSSDVRGYMTPAVKAVYRVGSNIKLRCDIDSVPVGGHNHLLHFTEGKQRVPESSITRRSSTSIEMVIRNAGKMESLIICKHNETGVGYVEVVVGVAPQNVSNFRCISNGWKELNCTFEFVENPVKTTFELTYSKKDTSFYKDMVLRPKINATNPTYWFNVNGDIYTAVTPYYEFTLKQNNTFGEITQNFTISNWNSIRSSPVMNLNWTQALGQPVNVSWRVETQMIAYSTVIQANLTAEVKYTTKSESPWTVIYTTFNSSRKGHSLLLHDLTAFTWYDVQVRIRISNTSRDELWSDYQGFVFQTRPRIPDKPPDTDVGAFWVSGLNDVFIYWRLMRKDEENGAEPGYNISKTLINGKSVKLSPIMGVTWAKFQAVPDGTLEFEMHSKNAEGASRAASYIKVPRLVDRVAPPRELKKNLNRTIYTLSWKEPEVDAHKIKSYTVFWCKSKAEGTNQCEHSIDFRRVNASVKEFTVNTTDGINFAVSANTQNSSSGMVWALCTAAESDDIGKLKSIWTTKITSTSMEIQWNLECVDRPILREYNISYCPITSPRDLTCKNGTEMHRNLSSSHRQFNITGLKPYTTYRTIITMISATRNGPPSEPWVNTTYEAIPSRPLNLAFSDVQNTSMLLRWNVPDSPNGKLQFYEIWYNAEHKEMGGENLSFQNQTFRLENLTSYTEYEILVRACTNVGCSEGSNTVKVKTVIGTPGPVDVKPKNDEPRRQVIFTWSEPVLRAGNLDYYEIEVNRTGDHSRTVTRTKERRCSLNVDSLGDSTGLESEQQWQVRIRAVNVLWSAHAKLSPQEIGGGAFDDQNEEADEEDFESAASEYPTTRHQRHSNFDQPLAQSLETVADSRKSDRKVESVHVKSTTEIPRMGADGLRSCTEDDVDIERSLAAKDKHKQILPGVWSTEYTHVRDTSSFKWEIIATIVLLAMMVVVLIFYGYKRFFKLKKGVVVLPPGLTDIAEKPHPDGKGGNGIIGNGGGGGGGAGGGNGGTFVGAFIGRGNDLVITPDSIGSHTRLGGVNAAEAMFDVTCMGNMQRSPTSSLHEQEQSLLDPTDTHSSTSSTNMLEHEELAILSRDEDDDLGRQAPAQLQDVVKAIVANKEQQQLQRIQGQQQQQQLPQPVQMPQTVIKPAPNGYVTIAQRSDGYTQLGDLLKPPEGIAGYVTHKQLADFGQRMQ